MYYIFDKLCYAIYKSLQENQQFATLHLRPLACNCLKVHLCDSFCDCLGQLSQVFFVKLIRRCVIIHIPFMLSFPNFSFHYVISSPAFSILLSPKSPICLNLTPKIFISLSIHSIVMPNIT